MMLEKRKIFSLAGTGLLIFAGLGVYSLITGKFQLCLFRIFTGLPCPGCGLTRSFLALIQGDPVKSFQYHPLLLPVLFTLFTVLIAVFPERSETTSGIFISFFQKLHRSKYFYMTVFLFLILVFIVRMILFFPGRGEVMIYDKQSIFYVIYSFLK